MNKSFAAGVEVHLVRGDCRGSRFRCHDQTCLLIKELAGEERLGASSVAAL
jgi:hypothetical protein